MKKNMATGDSAGIVLIDETLLKSKVYTIRGVKVLLDADLAKIYGYSTKRFNEQVKANIERFDDDFRFQLTKEEVSALNLRSEKPTSSLITYIVFRKFL
ncbi:MULTISPECIES: ORF6N domain-containing protein [unclassified Fibrobacter]|uniref:ORF6N domain-containing protein n=1 Tax=unclassified Fibrobacter TaxID=2634177 RepID=UPI000D6B0AA8|nr:MULTISPECIES: ORF6N domain-containing protein [unclassified Fibrobacter]PWJ63059.1 ORF6N domain-containing protein [Fibrobacter sp. UWR4]PZW68230.1 ORF6N domain-containing protein [Fibrobacter sp. UWR1]